MLRKGDGDGQGRGSGDGRGRGRGKSERDRRRLVLRHGRGEPARLRGPQRPSNHQAGGAFLNLVQRTPTRFSAAPAHGASAATGTLSAVARGARVAANQDGHDVRNSGHSCRFGHPEREKCPGFRTQLPVWLWGELQPGVSRPRGRAEYARGIQCGASPRSRGCYFSAERRRAGVGDTGHGTARAGARQLTLALAPAGSGEKEEGIGVGMNSPLPGRRENSP